LSKLCAGGRRVTSSIQSAAGVSEAGADSDQSVIRRQPTDPMRGVLRTDIKHNTVWGTSGVVRLSGGIQHTRGDWLRRADPAVSILLHRGVSGTAATEARVDEPIQGAPGRFPGGPATAAHQR